MCGSARFRKHDDSDDTDAVSVVERPVLSEISKFLPRSGAKASDKYGSFRKLPAYGSFKSTAVGKDNSPNRSTYPTISVTNPSGAPNAPAPPPEILNFIEKQEGYIEQLERESLFCRVE